MDITASWNGLSNGTKGILFASLTLVVTALQPVLAKARPPVLDSIFFSFTTMLFELVFFLPLLLKERLAAKPERDAAGTIPRPRARRTGRLLVIAACFALALPLFFLGFDLTDATTGSIMLKSSVLFSLAYGYRFIQERVTPRQVVFSIVMIAGLVLALAGGTTTLVINLGALLLVFVPFLWTIGHGLTRPLLRDGEITGTTMIVIRNAFGAATTLAIYIAIFPASNLAWLLVPEHVSASALMAASYAAGHFGWYKAITYMDLNKATIIVAPTPIITSLFEYIVLGTIVTWFDVAGMIIVTGSILVIFHDKRRGDTRFYRATRIGK